MRLLLAILLLLIAAPACAQQSQGMSQAMVVSSCGGGSLPNGALNQLTMDTTGRLCQSGIGSNVCSQATAYLARTVGGNEGGNAVNITALICGLVSDGVIDGTLAGTTTCGTKLDALYILAQQNAADAVLNLCGTSYGLTGTATFTAYQGFSAFPTGGLDSGFNTALAPSPHYTQNSATIGAWVYNTPDAGVQIGIGFASGDSSMFARYSDGSFYIGINSPNAVVAAYPGIGLFTGDRSSAGSAIGYYNGNSVGSVALTSASPTNATLRVGSLIATFPTTTTISASLFGASLGATLQLALYNRLRTYMTAVGVP